VNHISFIEMHSVTTNMFKEYTRDVLASISVYCVLIMEI